ncbi:hypothetical protein [Youngiibacter multivorans]|uniref:DUF4276 family protein n=1 Tax=Youngiibacter multivorans TaxID=937251 RepID=A0ABS4G012_9CLOT|nr:hypothetical protein [Youngiibacter multivorans]MBP1917889.1 hypothetical protein [Youngiibacter multivorans]
MKRGIVIFVEGDTEDALYRRFKDKLHSMTENHRFEVSDLIVCNLKGIGNFKIRVQRKFEKDIRRKHPEIEYTVFLCYDTDIFDFASNPPVKWTEVESMLKNLGAVKVHQVKARHSIEDWFLNDLSGLLKFLKLPPGTNPNGNNGYEKMKNLFKKSNRVYVKGEGISGFIDSINLDKVMCINCNQLKPLCKVLNVQCPRLNP